MILLDTDHLTLLSYPTNPRCQALIARMEASSDQQFGTTIMTRSCYRRTWTTFDKSLDCVSRTG
jgi:hypothetical protein